MTLPELNDLLNDIEVSLEAMEQHNDRSPRTELTAILRAHNVPPHWWKWQFSGRCKALAWRWRACGVAWQRKWDEHLLAGANYPQLVELMGLESNSGIARHKHRLGLPVRPRTDWRAHIPTVRDMLAKGHTADEVAAHLGSTAKVMRQGLHRAGFAWPDGRSLQAKQRQAALRAKHGLPPLNHTPPGPKPRKKA